MIHNLITNITSCIISILVYFLPGWFFWGSGGDILLSSDYVVNSVFTCSEKKEFPPALTFSLVPLTSKLSALLIKKS